MTVPHLLLGPFIPHPRPHTHTQAESLLNAANDNDPSAPLLISHLRLRVALLHVTATLSE